MKEFLRRNAAFVITNTGISRIGRNIRSQKGAIVLYAHRIADDNEGYLPGIPPAYFRAQLAYLTKHYHIIPLRTLVDALTNDTSIPERSVVLTFDDGFRDNYDIAFPILQEFKAPATIFVVTDALSDGRLPWAQQVGCMLQLTKMPQLPLESFGHPPFDLRDAPKRKQHSKNYWAS